MIMDYGGQPRYADKEMINRIPKPISPELKRLYAEMSANPRFHISREYSWYPAGFPSRSPGWQ